MSGAVQSLAWAMSIRNIDASSFRVLIALVNRANHRTGECFPSHKVIADDAEMSVATVKRVIERLVERGLVTVHPQSRDNGAKSVNRYRLAIAQDELPIAQNELGAQLTGELCNRTRNKEPSRAKALSVRAKTIEEAYKSNELEPVEAENWAVTNMKWHRSDARAELVRFIDSAMAAGRTYKDWMAAWRNWCRSPYCKTRAAGSGGYVPNYLKDPNEPMYV